MHIKRSLMSAELFPIYLLKVYLLWITSIWVISGKPLITLYCAQTSWCVQHAIRLLEHWRHFVYHAIVCHPSLITVTPQGHSEVIRWHRSSPWLHFSSGSHPFDYKPAAACASSGGLSYIRESCDLPDSQFSKSSVHTEATLKTRIIECKPVTRPAS